MKDLKGKFTISRVSTNEGDYIAVELIDESSGSRIVDIKMTPEILGNAITGLAHQECTFVTRNLDRVGKKRETKIERVYLYEDTEIPQYTEEKKKLAEKLCSDYTKDGWIPSIDDLFNVRKRGVNEARAPYAIVSFVRFV